MVVYNCRCTLLGKVRGATNSENVRVLYSHMYFIRIVLATISTKKAFKIEIQLLLGAQPLETSESILYMVATAGCQQVDGLWL
jgi:hypothetical protein